jgi:hypothetical protein
VSAAATTVRATDRGSAEARQTAAEHAVENFVDEFVENPSYLHADPRRTISTALF